MKFYNYAWFLFDFKYEDAVNACELRVHAPMDGAYPLSGTEYVFVVKEHQKVTSACPRLLDEYFPVIHSKKVTVPGGCTGTSHHFIVTGMAEL
jgi:hypothetical protein